MKSTYQFTCQYNLHLQQDRSSINKQSFWLRYLLILLIPWLLYGCNSGSTGPIPININGNESTSYLISDIQYTVESKIVTPSQIYKEDVTVDEDQPDSSSLLINIYTSDWQESSYVFNVFYNSGYVNLLQNLDIPINQGFFGMSGTLLFRFANFTNNQIHNVVCPDVAFLAVNGQWIFSNKKHFGLPNNSNLKCLDESNNIAYLFSVKTTADDDETQFIISAGESDINGNNLSTLSLTELTDDIIEKYNLLPLQTKISLLDGDGGNAAWWDNVMQIGAVPHDYSYSITAVESIPNIQLIGATTNGSSLKSICNGDNMLFNDTDIQQTLSAAACQYTQSFSNQITTTSGYSISNEISTEAGGEVGIPLVEEGSMKVTYKLGFSYSTSTATAISNSSSYTYIAPAQNILMYPHSCARIKTNLVINSYTADFKFWQYLAPFCVPITLSQVKTDYNVNDNTEWLVPGFDILYSESDAILNNQLLIDPNNRSIKVQGQAQINGTVGTLFTVDVLQYDMSSDICQLPSSLQSSNLHFLQQYSTNKNKLLSESSYIVIPQIQVQN